MKLLLLLSLSINVLLNLANAQQPSLEWAKSFGGAANQDVGMSIAADASGNVYTTGYFSGTVDFDPGTGTSNLTSNGGIDAFVQKLDPSGNLLWAKSFGGTSNDYGYAVTVDASGNVYTIGEFLGTADFDPGTGTNNLSSNGGPDVFVQKLSPTGILLWVKSFGGTGSDDGNSITVDASGNIFTTGSFVGTVDFNPGAATSNLTSNGSNDIFVQKLNPSGNLIWAKSFGGTGIDGATAIRVDASGFTYTTGRFQGTVDFDPGTGTSNLTSNGSNDIFVQKLNPLGNLLWAKSFGGTGSDFGYSAIDASGNVYTTGYFSGTVDFDPGTGTTNLTSNGSLDVFVQKLTPLTTGIIENSFEYEPTVYPNPTLGNFSIDLGAVHESSVVSITDILGRLIESKSISQSQILNLSIEEPAGIYILSIQVGDKKAVFSIVKE
jgi:hypothetical protein